MADKIIQDDTLTAIADAIRQKKNSQATYTPLEMPSAIQSIETGIDTSDATATAHDIVSGKTAYVNSEKITGTHTCSTPTLQEKSVTPSESSQTVTPDSGYDGLSQVNIDAIESTYVGSGVTKKAAATYTPGTSDQTIASGQYLEGMQIIEGDENLVAENIKSGITIFNVEGTLETGSGGIDTSDATATAGDIASGKTAYVNSEKITGTLQTLMNATGTPKYDASSDKIEISCSLDDGEKYIVENKVRLTVPVSDFGDADPSDVVLGKTFTSTSGLKVTGTREESEGSSGGLTRVTGSLTLDSDAETVVINTGLSVVKSIIAIKGTSNTSDTYFWAKDVDSEIHACAYRTTYMTSFASSDIASISGGDVTLNQYSTSYPIKSGTIKWVAFGEA